MDVRRKTLLLKIVITKNLLADSCIYGALGLPIGFLIALILPELVFHTTKPSAFISDTWFFGAAGLVAIALAISCWITKSRRLPLSRILVAVSAGLLAASLAGYTISSWFAHTHNNHWGYGDFFELITPFSYSILLVGLISCIAILLLNSDRQREPLAESGRSGV